MKTFFHHPIEPRRQLCQGQPLPDGWTGPHTEEESDLWAASFPPKLPEVPDVPKVTEITNRQFRLALRRVTGIYPSTVTTAIYAIEDADSREDAVSEWEFANTLSRDSLLLVMFADKFGVTAAQLDEIFTLGDTLQ